VNEILRYTVNPLDVFKLCNALVTNRYGTILSRTRQCVAYADDVLIRGRRVRAIEVVAQINLQAPCVLYIGQAFRYTPENAFYIFNQQIYFIF